MNGEVRGQMPAAAYFKMKRALIPEILSAYNSLAETVDIIVIEGAGSPAEINLKADDIVNMGLARLVDAPVLLAGDIDRGGVFAQLYGTVALLEPEERARIKGCSSINSAAMWRSCAPALRCWKRKRSCRCWGSCPT